MSDIKSITTEDLIPRLEWASYYWGSTRSTGRHEAAGTHRKIANDSRAELERRLDEKKRAINAGLERERELRETVSDLRVALQHEQNQRAAGEHRCKSEQVIRDILDALGVSLAADPVRMAKGMRARAESAEAERDDLRAEVGRLRTLLHRVTRPDEVQLRDGTLGQRARSAVGRFQERLKRNGHYADENCPTGGCDCGCGVTG